MTTRDTNTTISTTVCNYPLSNLIGLTISVTPETSGKYYEVPACLSGATVLGTVNFTNAIISDWSVFPPSLSKLIFKNCRLIAADYSGSPTTPAGFNATGHLDWSFLWDTFSLTNMTFDGCGVTALPSEISANVTYFALVNNGRPLGPISADLYQPLDPASSVPSLTLKLSNSSISGTVPTNLFIPLQSFSITSLHIALDKNQLVGTIPYLYTRSTCDNYVLDLSDNGFTGIVPALVGAVMKNGSSFLSVDFSSNLLSGTISDIFLYLPERINTTYYSIRNNSLSGPLPSSVFSTYRCSDGGEMHLDFSDNAFSGTIPMSLIWTNNINAPYPVMSSISIRLNDNQLSGQIPPLFFGMQASSNTRAHLGAESMNGAMLTGRVTSNSTLLDLSNNLLNGTIPSNFLATIASPSGSVTINLQSNLIAGTFPDVASTMPRGATLAVNARNNSILGDAPTSCNGMSQVAYDLSMNQLNGSMPRATLEDCSNLTLDVSQNPNFLASIPDELFNVSVITFLARQTPLNGSIPSNLTSLSGAIDMSDSEVDFCSKPWHVSHFVLSQITCKLDHTSACRCPSYYTGCSLNCTTPEAPNPPPALSPCSPSTRPSPEFVCVDGVWTAPFTTTPILTIPSGAGTVVVDGNVTSTSIVINGAGSQIVIRGCAANLTMVTVTLTQEQLKQLGSSKTLQNLVTLSNASKCGGLDGVALDTQVSQGCRKVKTEKVVSSDGNTFGAYFTVNASGCNGWWIILVSVISAVVILGAIAVAIAVGVYSRKQKAKAFDRLAANGPAK